MKLTFIITSPDHSFLYGLFYVMAFLVSSVIFIFVGLRKKYPISTWLLITLFGVLFFIIGNKLVTLNSAGWYQLLKGNGLPETGRSILGGILGLVAGLIFAKRWLKFNLPVLDHLAYALPVGMAITRIGCLFGGCCYGTVTTLPWAVQYGNNFQVFQIQSANLQIPGTSTLSLPMHPTQIYDLLFCLGIWLLIYLTRKTWKATGSRLIFVILCYVIFRFVNEFFRDSSMIGHMGEMYLGIKIIQWMILCAAITIAFLLFYRETRFSRGSFQIKETYQINFYREFQLFLAVPAFLTLTYNWLAPFEILTLTFFTSLLLSIYFYNIYCQVFTTHLRRIIPLFFFFSLLTMSQINIDNGKKVSASGNKGWFSISTFGSIGNYPDNHYDCNGTLKETLKRNYSTFGAGVSYHYKPTDYRHLTISTNLYSNTDQSNVPNEVNYESTNINFMASYSGRYAGATVGISSGGSTSLFGSDVVPIIGGWAGEKETIFAEANLMNNYHLMGPPGLAQIGIGSGFGQADKNVGRVGLSIMPNIGLFSARSYTLGGYFAANVLIKDRFTLKPSLFVGKYFGGSMGLEMHLGKDKWKSRTQSNNTHL